MQVENAKLQREVAKKSVETTTEQIELAQTIYEQTILQQKQGTASLTDVLLADNALREAQQTYLSAVIDYLKADLELKKLTGNISTTNNCYNEYKIINPKKSSIHHHTVGNNCIVVIKLKNNKEITQSKVYQYDKEQAINVQADTLQIENVNAEFSYSGTFEPNKETKISAEIQGKINEVLVDAGSVVNKGSIISAVG
jgi:biotin carboxyl carrier protein